MLRELEEEEKDFIIGRAENLLKAVCDFADLFYWVTDDDDILTEHYPFNLCIEDAVGQTADFVEHIRENIGKFRTDA